MHNILTYVQLQYVCMYSENTCTCAQIITLEKKEDEEHIYEEPPNVCACIVIIMVYYVCYVGYYVPLCNLDMIRYPCTYHS